MEDIIVGLASPPGRGAIAIVRVAGPGSHELVGRVFRARRRSPAPRGGEALVGRFVDGAGSTLDVGVALFWRGPRSPTGQDGVDLMPHGSPALVEALVAELVSAGARVAAPGEFTRRALAAGRIDLAQAEAIADLVDAESDAQARIAARQLEGEVGAALAPLAEELANLVADVEAGLDFAEDEGLALGAAELLPRIEHLRDAISALLASSGVARRVREGARVVLLGPPNAGKSSLFNRLLGTERAIVTEEPGTTRDLVEETLVLEGLPLRLVDAAGVREARGAAEREGIRRAFAAAGSAHLVVQVYDLSQEFRPVVGERELCVATHADLEPASPPTPTSLLVDNISGEGIDEVRRELAGRLGAPGARPVESVALATERHRQRASEALEGLGRAAKGLEAGLPAELVALDLRGALASLEEILGHIGPEELLGRIFSRFCIGK